MITQEKWHELSDLFHYDPRCISESQLLEMISFANGQLKLGLTGQTEYWQAKKNQYAEQLELLRDEWNNREAPSPKPNLVRIQREKLIAEFNKYYQEEYDEDGIPHLIDFLIRQIPPEKFQPAETARSWMDQAFFIHVKQLVEADGMSLTDAYKENDRVFEQRPGSTFSRMRKKKATAAEWTPTGWKKDKTDLPFRFPEVIEFCKMHDQRGKS
jgi:hypothetical protein